MSEQPRNARALWWMLLSAFLWSFAGVLSKCVPWNPLTIVGVRGLLAALLIGGLRGDYKPRNDLPTWIGSLGVCLTSVLFIAANKLTTAANAIVLQYAMPAIVIGLNALIYKRRPGVVDVLACAVIMAGVVLCFLQDLGSGSPLGNLLALLSAVSYAGVFFAGRMKGADAIAYAYQGNLLSCVLLLCLPFDTHVAWNIGQLGAVLGLGLCMGLGYYCFGVGMRRGAPSVASSLVSNAEAVMNPLWVYIATGETPGALGFAGAALVLAAITLYGLWNGRQARRRELTA